jgi:hypothetical protein
MKDKNFLWWIHQRLVKVYGDDPNYDFMCKLRSIIDATDPNQETPNIAGPSLQKPITQTQCSVCGETQFNSPSGITCINGHGGLDE